MLIKKIMNRPLDEKEIWEDMLGVYKKFQHIIILIDSTLDESFLADFIQALNKDEVYHLSVAKHSKKSFIYILRLEKLNQLEEIKSDLIFCIQQNFNTHNDRYLVCGYGASQYSLDVLGYKITKSIALNDLGQPVFFRWFDPRVLIYLNHILDDARLLSVLNIFEHWAFYHASGQYQVDQANKPHIKAQSILINQSESIDLDLIEISNLAYQQSFHLEGLRQEAIEPTHIFKAIQTAYQKYQIKNNIDLIAYALYSIAIHPQFMQHPTIIDVLAQNWIERDAAEAFTTAMNGVSEDWWGTIRNELLSEEGCLNE